MRRTWIIALGAVLALTGCSGTPTPAPTVTVTVTVTATPTPVPTPAAAPADTTLTLGTPARVPGGTLTAYAVNADSAPDAPKPLSANDHWASADVEFCPNAASTVTTTWWRLADANHRDYEASSIGYNQFPSPSYAWGDTPVAAGTCHRGWITFVVADDANLQTVKYTNNRGDAIQWKIG